MEDKLKVLLEQLNQEINKKYRAIGQNEVYNALESKCADLIVLAFDAEPKITNNFIAKLANDKGIKVIWFESQARLAHFFGVSSLYAFAVINDVSRNFTAPFLDDDNSTLDDYDDDEEES